MNTADFGEKIRELAGSDLSRSMEAVLEKMADIILKAQGMSDENSRRDVIVLMATGALLLRLFSKQSVLSRIATI